MVQYYHKLNIKGLSMGENKTFEFHGTPGQYFVVFLVTLISAYIPIFGWPFGFNYGNKWIADNLTINGRKVKYQAGYGETLVFLLKNILLLIVTFGIYSFWFVPKSYRYILAHSSYADETPAPTVEVPGMPANPDVTMSIEPSVPTAPTPIAPAQQAITAPQTAAPDLGVPTV
jgi:uncharacterized membrane protein YjgN (DUF898 family)